MHYKQLEKFRTQTEILLIKIGNKNITDITKLIKKLI